MEIGIFSTNTDYFGNLKTEEQQTNDNYIKRNSIKTKHNRNIKS